MGLWTEPSSLKATHARPLAPNVAATSESLSILERPHTPAPGQQMALMCWPSVFAAEAKSLKPEPAKMPVTSWSSMPMRVSGLSMP